MKKTVVKTILLAGAFALSLAGNANASGSPILEDAITVDGQTYDTIIGPDLPNKGPFQQLVNGVTDYAPGEPGYVPRWDADGHYFVCPLLGQPSSEM